jgi:7,8-dihydropterin-6-yl-methyl-4-(beta-D-ribofuranosyl)aminobenzene 5'-phosphate synthase
MKRRDLIATALTAPHLLLAGCAGPASPSASGRPDAVKAQITVLYDAFGRDPALQKDWGYAAFVEVGGKRILFDTGNNAEVLAKNAAAKSVDLARLDFVVMSHRHGDHMGGMSYLLKVNPKVRIYAPKEGFGVYSADLPSAFYRRDESLPAEQRYYDGRPPDVMRFGSAWPQANITLIDKPTVIAPGIHLISLVSDKPGTLELRELSLAIETPDGMVIVVGCSHTGIDNIVKAATAIQPKIQFVVGGFHLVVAKDPDIEVIITTLRDTYKVAYVAPGHCTGEPTFTALRKAFGERCLYAGLGSTVALGVVPRAVGDSGHTVPSARSDDDLQSYQTLFAASGERRRGIFANLQRTATPGGAYLGQWRRSMVGCC